MGRLDEKVALISGSARGQGAAEAKLFAKEGAKVVIGDVRDEDGNKVEVEIRESGGEATFVHMDVTNEADWRQAVDIALKKYGKLNILVNNTGIHAPDTPIEECSEEQWERIMAVNAKGAFLGTKHAIPAMRRAGGGSIVNIVSGRQSRFFQESAYAASKGAILIFSRATASQHAADNIRCNSIFPGPIDTPMLREFKTSPEAVAARQSWVPLGRLGSVDDISYGVLCLASNEASYVTGTELVIDGGE